MQRVYFVYERDKDDPLFERCLQEIRYLNGEIPKASQNYIPLHNEEQFEEELCCTNRGKYYLYLLMKVYHFLERLWNIKILKMGGDFVRDPLGINWLMNISRVEYEKIPINIEDDFDPITTIGEEGDEIIYFEQKAIRLTKSAKEGANPETVKEINNTMDQHFRTIKRNSGIEIHEGTQDIDIKDQAEREDARKLPQNKLFRVSYSAKPIARTSDRKIMPKYKFEKIGDKSTSNLSPDKGNSPSPIQNRLDRMTDGSTGIGSDKAPRIIFSKKGTFHKSKNSRGIIKSTDLGTNIYNLKSSGEEPYANNKDEQQISIIASIKKKLQTSKTFFGYDLMRETNTPQRIR